MPDLIGSTSGCSCQKQQEAKRVLRQIVRERYLAADRMKLKIASKHALHSLEQLPEFITARCVALYWSLPEEVETHDFIEKWSQEKRILLPVMHGASLLLYPFTGREHLIQQRFGVWEPDPDIPPFTLPTTLKPKLEALPECTTDRESPLINPDLIVVPSVGFDRQGGRLGHGKGFYDRLLASTQALKIGICFGFQLFERIPTEKHDVLMDRIIVGSQDGSTLYICTGNDTQQ